MKTLLFYRILGMLKNTGADWDKLAPSELTATAMTPEYCCKRCVLAFIAVSNKRLYRAYLLKEKLRLVFQCEDVKTAKADLDGWIKWAQHCRIKVFVELQRKIRRHYDAILATMEHHLTNLLHS